MPTRSDPQYEYIMYDDIEDVEDIACYCPGGLYLLQMYDVIQDRYRIVHKLGHGGYSTVWLCWDMKTARYVAMKIGAADVGCTDIDVLSRIRASPLVGAKKGHDIGKRLIPKILGQTTINGPNGIHPCLITAPAMGSLSVGVGTFKLPVVRSICAQLAMGVEYLHSRGYVHGDLHMGNIFLRDTGINRLSIQQLYDAFGLPYPVRVTRFDGMPSNAPGVPDHVYTPIWFWKDCADITLSAARIVLSDFGTAFCPETESRLETFTLPYLEPPEAHFEPATPLSFPSDVWGMGCVMWRIAGLYHLLCPWTLCQENGIMDRMDTIGPLPEKWWSGWADRFDDFDANGKAKEGREVISMMDQYQESMYFPRRYFKTGLMDDRERDAFMDMIKSMIVFSPHGRLTASQVLETRWMRDWAIPEAEKSWAYKK